MDTVWQQSHVDDNAINRAMSELKKHLKHPSLNESLIKTHYRQGYSLQLTAQIVDVNKAKPTLFSNRKAASNKRLTILFASLVLTTLIFSAYWYTQPQDTHAPTPDFKLGIIDHDDSDAAEMRPLFNYNKNYLASTRTYLENGERKIHVWRLSDNKEIILTHPKFKKIAATAWQNQQDRLVLKGVDAAANKCEYLLADISAFDSLPKYSTIKPCNYVTDRYATLDKEGRFFYFTSENNEHKTSELIRFDLKTKKTLNLVSARPNTYGAEMPRLSPDGKRLAYLIWGSNGRVSVYLKELSTLETKLIYQSNYMEFSYALDWVNNGTLRYIDHNQMLTFNTKQNKLIQRSPLPRFVTPHHISHKSPTDIYFTTRNFYHHKIKQLDSFNRPKKVYSLFESKQNSDEIQYDSVNHNYYFSSYRSGQAQIYLANQFGLKQLTDFDNPNTNISSLKVSPDGKNLLYFRDRKQLETLTINTGDIKIVNLIDLNQILRVIWGSDSHSLIYVDKRENHQVKHYDFSTQQHKVFATLNTFSLFSNNKGVLFAVTDESLVDLTTDKVYPLPENINVTTASFIFDQVGEYFYATDRRNKLYRWQNNDEMAEVTHFDFLIRKMDITDKHEILLVSKVRRNTKIETLSWQPLQQPN
jgi:hypothetical protein